MWWQCHRHVTSLQPFQLPRHTSLCFWNSAYVNNSHYGFCWHYSRLSSERRGFTHTLFYITVTTAAQGRYSQPPVQMSIERWLKKWGRGLWIQRPGSWLCHACPPSILQLTVLLCHLGHEPKMHKDRVFKPKCHPPAHGLSSAV